MPDLYSKFTICRVKPDGSLDPSFNRDGIVLADFVNSLTEAIHSLAIDDRDRIVVGGWISTTATPTGDLRQQRVFALGRYDVSGVLDRTFGQVGPVSVMSLPSSWLERLWGWRVRSGLFGFRRWSPYGLLQPSGVVLTSFSVQFGESINAVTIDRANRILAAGWARRDIALARYTPSGSLDQRFGTGGLVTTDITSGIDAALSVVVDQQGRVLVGGTTEINNVAEFVVVRYTDDGNLDQGFGDQGIVTTNIGLGGSGIAELAFDADHRILAGGYLPDEFVAARYDRDGSLDRSFGTRIPGGGSARVEVSKGILNALTVDTSDRVVLGGSSGQSHVLARLDDRGQPDSSFGSGGLVQEDFSALATGSESSGRPGVNGVAVDADGRIVTVGRAGNVGVVARFNEDGSLDTSFGNSGSLVINPYAMTTTSLVDVAIDSKGRIVTAGGSRSR